MKKLSTLIFALMVSLCLFGCESSDSGPNTSPEDSGISAHLQYTLPNQLVYQNNGGTAAEEINELFNPWAIEHDITLVLTDGIMYKSVEYSGYALELFVKEDAVNAETNDPESKLGESDARELYNYVVVSNNDGFDNRDKFIGSAGAYNEDLSWDQFKTFYLLDLVNSGKVVSGLTSHGGGTLLPNMYNVSYAYDIYMFRKIDVKRPDTAGSIAKFEVGATTTTYVDDTNYNLVSGLTTTKFNVATISFTNGGTVYTNVKAISLDQFVTTYVVADPTINELTYTIVAVDDFSRSGWSYADMQQAYYLPDYDFICQVSGGEMVSGTKINFPVRIEVITTDADVITAADIYDYEACNPPAFATYK